MNIKSWRYSSQISLKIVHIFGSNTWVSRFSHFGQIILKIVHIFGSNTWTSRFSHFGRPSFTCFRRPGFHILDVHVINVFGVQVFTFWTSIIYNRRPKITVHVLLLPSNESSMLYIRCPSCSPYIASCDHV